MPFEQRPKRHEEVHCPAVAREEGPQDKESEHGGWVIQVDLHILIRDPRLIRVQVLETPRARDRYHPYYHVD